MTLKQYINNNFDKFLLLLMIVMAIYLFSCSPEPLKEIDDNFMEEYIKEAEAKFEKEKLKQDSINKANDK